MAVSLQKGRALGTETDLRVNQRRCIMSDAKPFGYDGQRGQRIPQVLTCRDSSVSRIVCHHRAQFLVWVVAPLVPECRWLRDAR